MQGKLLLEFSRILVLADSMKKRVVLFALAVISCSLFANDQIQVLKHSNPEFKTETYYEVSEQGCSIGWTLQRFTESSGFGIGEESQCGLSLEKQMPLRAALLKKVLADTNNLQGMRNFAWGALKRGDATDEYAQRFTMAASKSPGWDKRKGKMVSQTKTYYDDNFFPKLLNKENVFSEVVATFAAQGFILQVNGVENVIVNEVDVRNAGMTKKEKLPVDCLVSFSVTKKGGQGSNGTATPRKAVR